MEDPLSMRSLVGAGGSTATMPLTVIAMLIGGRSTMRRGRRAATRNPRSSGTGSRAESCDQPGRAAEVGRAESASARTVLVRAARTAGTKVAGDRHP